MKIPQGERKGYALSCILLCLRRRQIFVQSHFNCLKDGNQPSAGRVDYVERKMQEKEQKTYWFALNVPYNRAEKVVVETDGDGIQTFRPMQQVEVFRDGEKVYREQPIIPSLLFIRCSEQYLREIRRKLPFNVYVYTKPRTANPAPIPEKEMENFIKVMSLKVEGMTLLDADANYLVGESVRVTQGVFKGAEGYIKRIKGNKRLIVSVEGVVAVATSYIPMSFLEKI